MPQIAVINEASAISDAEVQAMLPAFTHQWNVDLKPIWGVDDATFAFVPNTTARPKAHGGSCSWIIAIRPEHWLITI